MQKRDHACPRISSTALALAIATILSPLRAAPLDPPAGPVTAVYKSLDLIEPRVPVNDTNTPGSANYLFVISQPGSYYLSGNVTGVAEKGGISIASSGVTLDLGGFTLQGVPESTDGIRASATQLYGITIRNGTVRNWGGTGLDLLSTTTHGTRIVDILVDHNGATGLLCGNGSSIAGCVATANGNYGIVAGDGCTVANCAASENVASGIGAGTNSSVTNCAASANSGDGIRVSAGSVVTDSSASGNSTNGFVIASACTIQGCSAYANIMDGVSAGNGCIIRDVTARSNTKDGIYALAGCLIRDSLSSVNGQGAGDGANIHTVGGDGRLEGNVSLGADRGIQVEGGGNIIARNTCSGSATNWVIASGNIVAPIVSGTTNAAAINGNTYAGSMGSTDPNANFTY